MKRDLISLLIIALISGLTGCNMAGSAGQVSAKIVQSNKPRILNPQVAPSDLAVLTGDNNDFAFSLYERLRSQDGNLVLSPFSISEALAMAYAGAAGETAPQMAAVLHFTLPQERLHPAFNAVDQALNAQGNADNGFKLSVVNALWGRQDVTYVPAFLDTLAQNYGAGMRLLDFNNNPEAARLAINAWVSSQTNQKINDLLPPGSIDKLTELVLTNAVYFKAVWVHLFEINNSDGPFTLIDGSQVNIPLMQQTQMLNYFESDQVQMVELPYINGSMSMIILLPKTGTLDAFEASLDPTQVTAQINALKPQLIKLTMPKFKFDASFTLGDTLSAMGMPDAFDDALANFTGMDAIYPIKIGDVVHKASIAVDEEGTEAAAATGVAMTQIVSGFTGTPLLVNADHPFMFLITDRSMGTILFLGRVVNPA